MLIYVSLSVLVPPLWQYLLQVSIFISISFYNINPAIDKVSPPLLVLSDLETHEEMETTHIVILVGPTLLMLLQPSSSYIGWPLFPPPKYNMRRGWRRRRSHARGFLNCHHFATFMSGRNPNFKLDERVSKATLYVFCDV